MSYRQYTKCYAYTSGDRPYNEDDLVGFILGVAGPGATISLIMFALSAANPLALPFAAVALGATYAAAITAAADQWLYHRLICVRGSGPRCAVGTVEAEPEDSTFGSFDNDQHFNMRLMPHRAEDAYSGPNGAYPGGIGPALDPNTSLHPANDLYLDGNQGTDLLAPDPVLLADLGYDLTSSSLHCEAEGSFWQDMKDTAAAQGLIVAGASMAGAAAGAAAGCAIGALFGGIGCLIGAIIGAIIGALAGLFAGAAIGAGITFAADPGDVSDAQVGDTEVGPLRVNDRVVAYGRHVYDGFHTGWHEFHPLMLVVRIPKDAREACLEWDPDFEDGSPLPADLPGMPAEAMGLAVADIRVGLESPRFRARAEWLRRRWCAALGDAYSATTKALQEEPDQRWTIHPDVDGCAPDRPR